MAILSEGCQPDNFECESFLESNTPDILALGETNLDDSIDSGSFSVRGELMYISLIVSTRLSLTHLHGFQQLVLLPQFIEIIFFSFVPTE